MRDRIAELRHELLAVQGEVDARRFRRAERNTVALVGYTNAGKSSWMRALTGSEVLVKDQLFATLDTTVRQLTPKTRPPVLVSDTVGFIKKLPHDLVASFRSTLEEARDASLLVYVVDAADPEWRAQLDVTVSVLREIDAHDRPSLLVLNKADRLDDAQRAEVLEGLDPSRWGIKSADGDEPESLPSHLLLSAHRPEDVELLHERIAAFFARDLVETEILVPYRDGRLLHELHERYQVLEEHFEDEGTRVRVKVPAGDPLLPQAPRPVDPFDVY